MKTKISIALIFVILLTAFLIFEACQKETLIPTLPKKEQLKSRDNSNDENNFNVRLRKVKEDRVADFVAHLKVNGVDVQDTQDFLQKFGRIDARQQLSEQLGIDLFCILVHLELADLIQLGLSEIDAQMLHFSQWNYTNLFTGEIVNRNILANANPEKLLMDISGWAAGSINPIVDQYQVGIPEIENWINAAHQAGDCVIEYNNGDPGDFEPILACNN